MYDKAKLKRYILNVLLLIMYALLKFYVNNLYVM